MLYPDVIPQIKLSYNNSKIKALQEYTGLKSACFDIPAGWTCPGANICKARVNVRQDGSRYLEKFGKFTCYATKSELCYTSVFNLRWANYSASLLPTFVDDMVNLLSSNDIRILRLHSAGDFYNPTYFQKWYQIASQVNTMIFGYSKLSYAVSYTIRFPLPNFALTYSMGGREDMQAMKLNLPHCTVVCPGDDFTGDIICGHDRPWEDFYYIRTGLSFGLNLH